MMKTTISEELGLSGHVLLIETKSLEDWLKQAKDSLDRAEKYGSFTIGTMHEKERDDLRQSLKALGFRVDF